MKNEINIVNLSCPKCGGSIDIPVSQRLQEHCPFCGGELTMQVRTTNDILDQKRIIGPKGMKYEKGSEEKKEDMFRRILIFAITALMILILLLAVRTEVIF